MSKDKSKTEKPVVECMFYTVGEATARLGISRQTLYDYMRTGALPSALAGRKRLFLKTEVHKFGESLSSKKYEGIDNNQGVKAGGDS